MPVIGDPITVNDTMIDQIVMSARAAIDKSVELGVTDGNRVGVGGHSYGAFMTANLLAHSDLFRAGIARSGAYQPYADSFRVPEANSGRSGKLRSCTSRSHPSCTPTKSTSRSS